jgi:probable addiction module antidote protein
MAIKTARWDTAETLKTKEEIAAYLDAALEDGDPELLKLALGNVARAKGMTDIAKTAGLGRQSLYKALSPEGNPEFATVANVLKALGLRLSVAGQPVSRGKLDTRPIKTVRKGRAIARGEADSVLLAAAASRRTALKRTKRA